METNFKLNKDEENILRSFSTEKLYDLTQYQNNFIQDNKKYKRYGFIKKGEFNDMFGLGFDIMLDELEKRNIKIK